MPLCWRERSATQPLLQQQQQQHGGKGHQGLESTSRQGSPCRHTEKDSLAKPRKIPPIPQQCQLPVNSNSTYIYVRDIRMLEASPCKAWALQLQSSWAVSKASGSRGKNLRWMGTECYGAAFSAHHRAVGRERKWEPRGKAQQPCGDSKHEHSKHHLQNKGCLPCFALAVENHLSKITKRCRDELQ